MIPKLVVVSRSKGAHQFRLSAKIGACLDQMDEIRSVGFAQCVDVVHLAVVRIDKMSPKL